MLSREEIIAAAEAEPAKEKSGPKRKSRVKKHWPYRGLEQLKNKHIKIMDGNFVYKNERQEELEWTLSWMKNFLKGGE